MMEKELPDIFEYHNNFSRYKDVECSLEWGDPSLVPDPKITVIMPVYKRPDYFRIALKSVIDQDFEGQYEIVVVDNNDETEGKNANQLIVEEINSPKVLYYRNAKNLGLFGNWNRGIELARAPYITYCHDDDLLVQTCLSNNFNGIIQNPTKSIIYKSRAIDLNGNALNDEITIHKKTLKNRFFVKKKFYNINLYDLFMVSPTNGGGCIFQKSHLVELGGFNELFYPSADYALMIKLAKNNYLVGSDQITYKYRIGDNISIQVHDQCRNCDKFFRNQIKQFIKFPNLILNILINSNDRLKAIEDREFWNKEKHNYSKKNIIFDHIIIKIINKILKTRHYSFKWSK